MHSVIADNFFFSFCFVLFCSAFSADIHLRVKKWGGGGGGGIAQSVRRAIHIKCKKKSTQVSQHRAIRSDRIDKITQLHDRHNLSRYEVCLKH